MRIKLKDLRKFDKFDAVKYDFSLFGGPQLKATYKMDNFYFSGTLGFDLLTTVGATNNLFAEFLDFPDYRNYTKNVPFVLSIGFGYIL